jgi:hypothetical protein
VESEGRGVLLDLPRDAHAPEQYAVIACEHSVELWIAPPFVLIHRRRADELAVVFSAWIYHGGALVVVWTEWMMQRRAPCALGTAGRARIFALRLFKPHHSPLLLSAATGDVSLNSPGVGVLLS